MCEQLQHNLRQTKIGLTSCIFIDNGDCFPLVKLYDVQHSSADGGVFRMEIYVETVFVVHRGVLPPRLDVRDF